MELLVSIIEILGDEALVHVYEDEPETTNLLGMGVYWIVPVCDLRTAEVDPDE